jgi:hypothetical protein
MKPAFGPASPIVGASFSDLTRTVRGNALNLRKKRAGPLGTGRLVLLGRRCCYEVRRDANDAGRR